MLITSPIGAHVPDAPSLLWSTFPSKALADDHALSAAKDWIDKRSAD